MAALKIFGAFVIASVSAGSLAIEQTNTISPADIGLLSFDFFILIRLDPTATYGSSNSSVPTTADINGDGKIDIIAAHSGLAYVMLGNGNGAFGAESYYQTGNGSYDMIASDTNGDGKLDIISSNSSDGNVGVLLGNGNGTFKAQTTYATDNTAYRTTAGDFNGDGKVDLVVGDLFTSTIDILYGNGDGTFQARRSFTAGTGAYEIISADLNEDGVADLAATDGLSANLNILLNGTTSTSVSGAFTISTQSNAENALATIDSALSSINSKRANIGAIQSRLDFATNNAANMVENVSAARSQIADTDMAQETAEFARLQILQSAGLSVLGQANLNSRLALKLLENI